MKHNRSSTPNRPKKPKAAKPVVLSGVIPALFTIIAPGAKRTVKATPVQPSRIRAPAVTPKLAVALTGARAPRARVARHRAPPVKRPTTIVHIADMRLIKPEFSNLISAIPFRETGSSRSEITVPVCPVKDVTDEVLFEGAADATKKFYLPRYRIAEETVSGKKQFRVLLEQSAQGGSLTIHLERFPAEKIAEKSREATEIQHAVNVKLKHRVPVGQSGGVQQEWDFQELTEEGGGLCAVLPIGNLSELTQIFQAITEPEYGASLVLIRVVHVAIPVDVKSQVKQLESETTKLQRDINSMTSRQTALQRNPDPRKRSITQIKKKITKLEKGIKAKKKVLAEKMKQQKELQTATLFRPVSRTLELVSQPVPFVFSRDLHPYVTSNVAPVSGQSFGLIRQQVNWNGTPYSYFQDQVRRHIFYYLPDCFKIARRPESPHNPFMSVRFTQTGGSRKDIKVTLEYVALPYVDPDRLEQAAEELRNFLPASQPPSFSLEGVLSVLEGAEEPHLRLLPEIDPKNIKFILGLPRDVAFQKQEGAMVTLNGVKDVLTLSMENFQTVYDAMFGDSAVLFKGQVEIGFGDEMNEVIPFSARMDDLAGDIFDYKQKPDQTSGGIKATLRNAIESNVRIDSLTAELRRGDNKVTGLIQELSSDLPIELKPDEELTFIVAPSTTIAGSGSLEVVFDLDGVTVVPVPEAVWNAILDPTTPATYMKKIKVKTYKEVLTKNQIEAIEVEFEQGDSVELNAETLEAESTLYLPIGDIILRRVDTGEYRYRLTIVRIAGQSRDEEWRTESGILHITDDKVKGAG